MHKRAEEYVSWESTNGHAEPFNGSRSTAFCQGFHTECADIKRFWQDCSFVHFAEQMIKGDLRFLKKIKAIFVLKIFCYFTLRNSEKTLVCM